jgi:hypothetical protein
MYEMEGTSPGSSRQASRLPVPPGATRRPPVPDTRVRCRFPGACPRSGDNPGRFPFPTVNVFLLLSFRLRKGSRPFSGSSF